MVSIVSLQGVVALLGRFPALAGADLEVGESEIVLVQGPNGAGKSTLLRVCAGLLRIESGRAEVLGHDRWPTALPCDGRSGCSGTTRRSMTT